MANSSESVSFTINANTKPAGKALLELSRLLNKAVNVDTKNADKNIIAQQNEYKKLGKEVNKVFKDIKALNDADKKNGGKAQLPFNQYAANEKKIATLTEDAKSAQTEEERKQINADIKKYKDVNLKMDKYAQQALKQVLGTEQSIVADERSILGIRTESNAQTKNTTDNTKAAASAEGELADKTKQANDGMAQTAENAKRAKDAIKDATKTPNSGKGSPINMSAEDPAKHYAEIRAQVAALFTDLSNLQTKMRITPADDNISELIRRYSELQKMKKTIESMGMPRITDNSYATILRLLEQVNGQINAYKRNLKGTSEGHKEVAKSADKLKKLPSLVSTIKKGFNSMAKSATQTKKSFDSMARSMKSNFKHLITSITKYVLGFRSLFFLVRRLRKYIGEGIKNMAQFNGGMNHVNSSITRLLSSLLFLKNAWATAFSPILQFVTPWLEALIDKIAQAGNAFSRFLGSLLGQTQVFQAVKVKAADYADSLDNVGGSAGGAADKTKKLTDRLAAFDDLNVLGVDKDPDKNGRGGGGGAGDKYEPNPNDMFKIVSVGTEVLDNLKRMWEEADFSDLGETLAQKFKTALEDLNSKWPEIQETARKVGKSFGSFLTGFFADPRTFEELGKAVAEGLDTVGQAFAGFFESYEKGSIGTSIAAWFNGIITNLDWSTAGHNLGEAFATLFTEISSFFDNINTEELKKAIEDFIAGIDWSEVISSGIHAALSTIYGLTKIGASIVTGISDAIINMDMDELIQEIEDVIMSIDPNELVDTLGIFLESVVKSLVASGKLIAALGIAIFNLIKQGIDDMVQLFLESNDIDSSTEDMGEKIIQGLLQGILWALEGIGDWACEHIIEPFVNAITGKDGFDMHSPSKVTEQWGIWLVEGMLNGIDSLVSRLLEPFNKFKNDLANVWLNIRGEAATAWVMLRISMVQAFDTIKEAIKKPINGIITIVEGMINKVLSGINSMFSKLNSLPDMKISNPFNGKEYTMGFSLPQLKMISIPRLAQGAVIPPNKEFMAVLGDQSHGTNVEAPLETIKQAVAEVMSNSGNAEVIQLLQELIRVVESKNLTIGDKQIAQANSRYQKQQRIIDGSTF